MSFHCLLMWFEHRNWIRHCAYCLRNVILKLAWFLRDALLRSRELDVKVLKSLRVQLLLFLLDTPWALLKFEFNFEEWQRLPPFLTYFQGPFKIYPIWPKKLYLTNRMWFSVVYLTNRMWFSVVYVIYQTRATVFHRDIQTPRRELKIRRAAEYFWRNSRCLDNRWNTVSSVWYIFSIETNTKE